MKKIIFCAIVALISLTSCSDSVSTDELAEIVSTGVLRYVDTEHIAVIADAAGRENITIEKGVYQYSGNTYYIVNVNEKGRENCAALLY